MGLTSASVGKGAALKEKKITKTQENERIIAFVGNPNVGKSTLFNSLTGMHQHTGNWTGKTVESAKGYFEGEKLKYIAVDLPGTYSLFANSPEEELTRDFLLFGKADAVVAIVDAACLEHSLTLVLQVLEITSNVVLCVNLLDRAEAEGITVDLEKLERRLGIPVVGTIARKKKNASQITRALDAFFTEKASRETYRASYPTEYEAAVAIVEEALAKGKADTVSTRFCAQRLIESDEGFRNKVKGMLSAPKEADTAVKNAGLYLEGQNIKKDELQNITALALAQASAELSSSVCTYKKDNSHSLTRKLDCFITHKFFAYPVMLLFFGLIFFITIVGANYPSKLLARALFYIEEVLCAFFTKAGLPCDSFVHGIIVHGAYKVLAWVTSVMLVPMAIFFPLFTLLEDVGFLPRIAYNLDRPFAKCSSCGKQALTMCMGFGCNAAGVVGCRIISTRRERLLCILTNNFVPCNGRFPMLIALISMFVTFGLGTVEGTVASALALCSVILFSVLITFAATKLLSLTLLRGSASSFVLELPAYRAPKIGRVIVRSVFDRTLHVLARAVSVAAPVGALLWLLANIKIGNASLLLHTSDFLDPLGRLLGLDGVILLAFILGLPANEIVLPIIIMTYSAQGVLAETSISAMREILVQNGFSAHTAVAMIIFTIMHFPCSTTLLTIKKETASIKWTLVAAIFPTVFGMLLLLILRLAVYLL